MKVFNSGGAHINDAHCIVIVCRSLRPLIYTDVAGCTYFPRNGERLTFIMQSFKRQGHFFREKNDKLISIC